MRTQAAGILIALASCGRIHFGALSDEARDDGGGDVLDGQADAPVDIAIDGPPQFGALTGTSAGHAIAVAADGDIVIAGYITSAVDAGGGTLAYAGGTDAFVARYSASGEHRWSRSFGSAADENFNDVAVDAVGNVYAVGYHRGTTDFGGGPLTTTGSYDGIVLSLDANGGYRWAREIDSSTTAALDSAWSVAASGTQVFVSGLTLSPASAGGSQFSCGGTSQAIFVSSYLTDGTVAWGKCFGSGGFNSGRGLTIDSAANVTITGYYDGTPSFGGGQLPASTGLDLFVASFDSAGTHRWSIGMGSSGDDWGNRIAADAAGNVYATGFIDAATNFGGGTVTPAGGIDGYVASYTSTGAYRWAKRVGGTSCDQTLGVAVHPSGVVYVGAEFSGSFTFASQVLTALGAGDGLVLRYETNGTEISAVQVGSSTLSDEVQDVAFDGTDVLVTGRVDTNTSQCRNQPDSPAGTLFFQRL